MDGVDYSKRLDRERQQWQKSISDTNKANAEQVAELEAAHAHRTKSQQEAYMKDKLAAEKNYEDRYTAIDKAQKDALAEKSRVYEQALNADKEEFHKIHKENLKGFTERFNDLQKDYNRNLAERDEVAVKKEAIAEKQYGESVARTRKQAEEQVKEFKKNATGDSADIQEK
jgi:hypothetical protein